MAAKKTTTTTTKILTREEIRTAGQKAREVEVPRLGGSILMGPISARLTVRFQDLAASQAAARDEGREVGGAETKEIMGAMFDLLQNALVDQDGRRLYGDRDELLDMPIENLVAIAEALTAEALTMKRGEAGGAGGNG